MEICRRLYLEPCLAILGHFGGHLGLSRALLEPSWAKKGGVENLQERLGGLSGPLFKKSGGPQFRSPPRRLSNGVLGTCWSALWKPLGRSWGRLGPSWAPLGALLGHLGAILMPQGPIGSEKTRMPSTFTFLRLLKGFGFLEGAVEGSKGTWIRLEDSWRCVGGYLDPS